MTTAPPRTLIAALQVTLDGYILGPEGEVDWVDSWADGLGLLPEVDAFVLGGGMFPGYQEFWTLLIDDPAAATELLGREPYPREDEYARVAARTPHLVVSTTLTETTWPSAKVVGDLDAIRALKAEAGKPVYVVGGPGLIQSLIGAGLLDELRVIVHPVLIGSGTTAFAGLAQRQELELVTTEATESGRLQLTYRLAAA
jgi:dihydrofolate reductase